MPDPVLMLTAMGVAFAVAAILLTVIGWPGRHVGPISVDAGWVSGVAAGFFLGCWALGSRPHWPPRDDQERLLSLVLPAALLVELLAVFPRVPRGWSGHCDWPWWRAVRGCCCTGPALSQTSPGQGRANGRHRWPG